MTQPRRPPRICPHPSCPLPSDECRDRSHTRGGWVPDRVRGSRHERGYGTDWTRTVRRILRRDPICTLCHEAPSSEVDHVVPKTQGGGDHDTNLRGVCPPCHRTKTANEAREGREKR